MEQIIVNNRGSIVLDYNAVINAIPKHRLDWISANKLTTELEINYVNIFFKTWPIFEEADISFKTDCQQR